MKIGFIGLLLLLPLIGSAQTMNNSGNWNDGTKWASGNIGDAVTETVTIDNNVNPTILNGTSFTVGNTTLNQNNTLNINAGGTLNVGNAANARDLTTNNNANITVAGTLIIWGNLTVHNNLVWNISGTVIIKGHVQLNVNSNISVTGNLTVEGNWTGNNNNNVTVNSPGRIDVGGFVNIGNGSNLNGCAGCFHLGGACTGPSSFCGSGALPIVLMSFSGKATDENILLTWSTASEENFDKFIVERSSNGLYYDSIGFVNGAGNSKLKLDYRFNDPFPILGRNYYRLNSIDNDHSSEFSNVILVEFQGNKNIVVYPNPIKEASVQIHTNFNPSEGDRVEIYDNLGLKLMEFKISVSESKLSFNRALKPGAYLLRYISPNYSKTIRFTSN